MTADHEELQEVGAGAEAALPARGEQPKRLPGLWILSVLFGLGGMFHLANVFLATPLGVPVFGALAAAHLAIAAGLWLRLRAGRLGGVAALTLACGVLILDSVLDPSATRIAANAVLVCIALAIIGYLWLRRRCFGVPPGQRPGALTASTVVAGAIVLLLGVSWILWATIDDAPMEFPRLEFQPSVVADEDNAFVALSEMMERFPIEEDGDADRLLYTLLGEEPLAPDEWLALARQVMARWEDCLEMADEMLALERVEPPVIDAWDELLGGSLDWFAYCRELARLLILESEFHLADGRPQEALRTAEKVVDFGMLLCRENFSFISYLVGQAIVAMGLGEVRTVAASGKVSPAALRSAMDRLALTEVLRLSIRRALVREFAFQKRAIQALKATGMPEGVAAWSVGDLLWRGRLHEDKMPFVKLNMTLNLGGRWLDGLLDRTESYRPFVPAPANGPFGLPYMGPEVGLFHVVRNPVGDMLTAASRPAEERIVEQHFRSVASADLTRIFLALRCYHLERGRLPEGLEQLVPDYFAEIPFDPFTETDYTYEPLSAPPRVYSVGPDREYGGDVIVELSFADRTGEGDGN